MNTEALKNAFKRLQTWVKKNPKKAAVVGVVVVVLAYFAIKKGSEASGEELSSQIADDSTGLDSLGGGLATGESSDSGFGVTQSSTGTGTGTPTNNTPAPLESAVTSIGNFDGGGYGGGFDLSPVNFTPAASMASGFLNSNPATPTPTASIISTPAASVGIGASKAAEIMRPAPVASVGIGANQSISRPAPAPTPVVAKKPSATLSTKAPAKTPVKTPAKPATKTPLKLLSKIR